jgi:hypothetical protein
LAVNHGVISLLARKDGKHSRHGCRRAKWPQ